LFSPYTKADFSDEMAAFITKEAYEMSKTKEIVLFGTGKVFQDLFSYFVDSLGPKLIGVSDNDSNKWGTKINGLECISPKQLSREVGIIVLTSYGIMAEIIAGLESQGLNNAKPFIRPIFETI
jgi:NADH/NAD ratio-sensing transcriptional regulator Rex